MKPFQLHLLKMTPILVFMAICPMASNAAGASPSEAKTGEAELTLLPSSGDPGEIFDAATQAGPTGEGVLDPNGDGWISSTAATFSTYPTISDESEQFEESGWVQIFHVGPEPINDLDTGGSCGATEIVDNNQTGQHAGYYRLVDTDADPSNRNEYLQFRLRMAKDASGAFGYSILLDTDQSFGTTGSSPDPNATAGNPGFEIEILYGSGGGGAGVTMQDVDGGTSGNSTLSFSSPGVRDQKSYARFTNCTSDDPIFLDFYVSIGDMPAGITAQSILRMVFASSSSPNTALGGSASDIGGVDDNVYPDDDLAFTTVVEATPVLSFSSGYSCDDVDNDGVCDDVDNCTDISACNYDGSVSNVACVFGTTWYADTDSDGYGDSSTSQVACSAPSGYVSNSTDLCDDNTACNYDANSVTNAACQYNDACGVCGGSGIPAGDCDCNGNQNDAIGVCGGTCTTDSDSDGVCDDAGNDLCTDQTACNYDGSTTNAACAFATTWYADADGDGLGDSSDSQSSCTQPSGYVSNSTDLCDDNTACNYDGSTTNAACAFATTWYADADGDGLGDSSDSQSSCTQPSGYVSNSTDLCDDNTACNYDGSTTNAACAFATTWYADADGDGLGDSSDSQSSCTQPSGYVSNSTDLCDDNTACNYDGSTTNAACAFATTWYADADGDGLGDSSDSQSSCTQPSGFVSNSTDLCDDNTACNYDANSVTNAACQYNDVCGVCGGSGVPAGDCDCSGNQDDAIGVCGGTCTTDADSDGVCDDAGNDLCTNTSADNYTADPSVACTFSTPAITVTDTIMGCFDQVDAIALDLDTLHSGTGSWTYSITQSLTGTYASESLIDSELTIDFSGAGQDSSRIGLSGTNGSDNATFDFLVVEGTYPFVTSYAPNGGNEPTSSTGGMNMTFDGGYDVPLTVHYFADAVFAEASDGTISVHAFGSEATALTDSSGSLITLPSGDYFITGYTNRWGCFNPEPATSGTPTASPSYRLVTVPHLGPED